MRILQSVKIEWIQSLRTPQFWLIAAVWSLLSHYTLCALFYYLKSGVSISFWASNTALLILLFTPMLTMRLWSQDRQCGVDKLWKSSPISRLEVVVAKWLFCVSSLGVLVLLTVPLTLIIAGITHLDFLTLLWAVLAHALLIGLLAILGCFISAGIDSSIAAGMITWAVGLILWMGQGLLTWLPHSIQSKLVFFSSHLHWEAILTAKPTSQTVLFFWGIIGIGILGTVGMSLFKDKHPVSTKKLSWAAGALVVWSLASLLPEVALYREPLPQLASSTQAALTHLTDPIQFKLSGNWQSPDARKVKQLIKAYYSRNPKRIQIQDETVSSSLPPNILVTARGQSQTVDPLTFLLLSKTGDQVEFNGESVLNKLISQLIYPSKQIWWITGHKEKDPNNDGPEGALKVAQYLEKEGYLQKKVTLDEVPENQYGIVIILDPKSEFTQPEWAKLQQLKQVKIPLILAINPSQETQKEQVVYTQILSQLHLKTLAASILEKETDHPRDQKESVLKVLNSSVKVTTPPVFFNYAPLITEDKIAQPLFQTSPESWLQIETQRGTKIIQNGPFAVAVLLNNLPWVVFSDSDWLSNKASEPEKNAFVLAQILSTFVKVIPPVLPETQQIKPVILNQTQYGLLFLIFVLIFPLGLITMGWIKWRRQKV